MYNAADKNFAFEKNFSEISIQIGRPFELEVGQEKVWTVYYGTKRCTGMRLLTALSVLPAGVPPHIEVTCPY